MTFAAWLLAAGALMPQAGDRPADVVRLAQQAVEGDSVAAVSARWTARLRRNPTDRAAELGLATLARLTYRYEEAERRYTRLLPSGGQPAHRYAGYARLGYGIGLRWRGRVAEAESWLVQAVEDARALGDSSAQAEALLGLTPARMRTRGLPAAESLVTQASRVAPTNDFRIQALLRCTRAGVLASGARLDAAREAEAGVDLARRAGEARLIAGCRHAVAQDLLRRGDVHGAGQVWREVEAEQRRTRDRVGLAATLQWHGYASTTVGQYGAALAYYRASVVEGEASGNLSPVGFALTGLGRIALQVGDVGAGMRYAARARALFQAQGDRIGVLSMRGLEAELARTTGRLSEAAAMYRDAIAMAEHDERWDWAIPFRTALVDLALAARDAGAAGRLIDSAAAVARAHGMSGWEEGMAHQRGLAALLRNDLDGAERAFAADLAGSRTPFRNYRVRARLAEVYARRGDPARAERELVAATDTLELWRASLSDRDLRLSVFQLQEHWVDPDLGVATVLSSLAAADRVATAFHLAERRRARELLDRLVLANALRAASGDSAAAPGVTAPAVRLDQLAKALPNDRVAVLEYVTGRGGEPTVAFVVTRRGGTAHLLPPIDSLSDAIVRFTALVEAGNPPRPLAGALGSGLLGPVLDDLPAAVEHLVIVPDDILHRLPFDVLVMPDGGHVAERFATSVAPSATVMVRLWSQPAVPRRATLLALGDPVFARASTVTPNAAEPPAEALPRLPASRSEVEAAARYVPNAVVRLRDRASEAFLKGTPLRDYRVLHFATHAVVDERSVARTALALSPGDGEDGWVSPGDLAALRLNADLVVLSACRTAGGVVIRGEGIQGLTAPLLQAGARSIVATQWQVPDRATARFVASFYQQLAGGLPVADALRASKLDALRRGAPASEWAAFVLVGDPVVRVFDSSR